MTEAIAILRHLREELCQIYEPHEADSIARLLLEEFFGLSSIDLIKGKKPDLQGFTKWKEALPLLKDNMPVQYVLGYGYFAGRRFAVGEGVLIPRPETEQLVEMADRFLRQATGSPTVLIDLCTGTGCIAHTLALQHPHITCYAIDNSPQALYYAHQNARQLGAHTIVQEADVLAEELPEQLPMCDFLLSNPPYVMQRERLHMHPRVLEYEPPHALFVPDDAPLIFYQAIARIAALRLKAGGWIGVEINEAMGKAVATLFRTAGLAEVAIQKDFYGKERFVTARK
ncbi:MAG: peptide chain release factor N(5)-glutamine methyltransferase [Cytophagales bacterium]|nr:peptide chain release factor N(5)-glutamine methyltransferase [Bernardetiaceae bacterium]MDW8203581.1 peptide chain release factor N(5)-glutamine methyltransferase [Cytophagales bacterium]